MAHRSQVVLVEHALGAHRRAEQRHQPLDQLGLEPGQLGRLIPGVLALGDLEEVLRVPEREPAAARRLPDRVDGVAALPHPGDHPSLGRRCRRPAPVLDRDEVLLRPAPQGRGRDARDPARLGERDGVVLIVRSGGLKRHLRRSSICRTLGRSDGAPGPRRLRAVGPLRRPAALRRLAESCRRSQSPGDLRTADPLPAQNCSIELSLRRCPGQVNAAGRETTGIASQRRGADTSPRRARDSGRRVASRPGRSGARLRRPGCSCGARLARSRSPGSLGPGRPGWRPPTPWSAGASAGPGSGCEKSQRRQCRPRSSRETLTASFRSGNSMPKRSRGRPQPGAIVGVVVDLVQDGVEDLLELLLCQIVPRTPDPQPEVNPSACRAPRTRSCRAGRARRVRAWRPRRAARTARSRVPAAEPAVASKVRSMADRRASEGFSGTGALTTLAGSLPRCRRGICSRSCPTTSGRAPSTPPTSSSRVTRAGRWRWLSSCSPSRG